MCKVLFSFAIKALIPIVLFRGIFTSCLRPFLDEPEGQLQPPQPRNIILNF